MSGSQGVHLALVGATSRVHEQGDNETVKTYGLCQLWLKVN